MIVIFFIRVDNVAFRVHFIKIKLIVMLKFMPKMVLYFYNGVIDSPIGQHTHCKWNTFIA